MLTNACDHSLDRTNLGNAKGKCDLVMLPSAGFSAQADNACMDLTVAGLEKSLGLQTYDFNIGACIYYIIYFFADVPGGLAVKKYGFWLVSAATLSFGVVTLATAFIHNRASFL